LDAKIVLGILAKTLKIGKIRSVNILFVLPLGLVLSNLLNLKWRRNDAYSWI
jgi:hypothetical protein